MAYRIKSKTFELTGGITTKSEFVYNNNGLLSAIYKDEDLNTEFYYIDNHLVGYSRYNEAGIMFQSNIAINQGNIVKDIYNFNTQFNGKAFILNKDDTFEVISEAESYIYHEKGISRMHVQDDTVNNFHRNVEILDKSSNAVLYSMDEYIALVNRYSNYTCIDSKNRRMIDLSYFHNHNGDIILERNIYNDDDEDERLIRWVFSDYNQDGVLYRQRIVDSNMVNTASHFKPEDELIAKLQTLVTVETEEYTPISDYHNILMLEYTIPIDPILIHIL